MFGVACKNGSGRLVPAETRYMEVFDPDELPENVFHMIAFGSGTVVAEIGEHTCHFSGQTVICLDERKRFKIVGGHATDAKVVSFSPDMLNPNMTPDFIRDPKYDVHCDAHSFFQLSPFLTDNPDKMAFRVCDDTLNKFNKSIIHMEKNLVHQPDWYWSCRTRSYFMDMINIIEQIYHNYYLPEPSDDSIYPAKLQKGFREIIVFINNHLNEKITLDGLYRRFCFNKNKMQSMFRDYLSLSLHDYLNQRRFEEACYYLRFTELIGDEIADRLSFSGSQSFSRFFSQICGQAPEAFRKEKVTNRKIDMAELHQIEEESRKIREDFFTG